MLATIKCFLTSQGLVGAGNYRALALSTFFVLWHLLFYVLIRVIFEDSQHGLCHLLNRGIHLVTAVYWLLRNVREYRRNNKKGQSIYMDLRLSDWCCSVSMVWVKIPSREEQKFDRYSIRRLPMTISYLMSRQREIHYSGNKMLLVKTYISPVFHKGIRKWK